jgi:glutaminyl-peptide cyclotransferase
MKKYILLMFSACLLLFSCNGSDDSGDHGTDTTGQIPVYTPEIYNSYPHDAGAFTQGLIYADGFFYEGTGLYEGKSSLRKVAIETGEVLQKINLAPEYFGEGIALYDNKIIQLTWQNKKGFVYDKYTFQLLEEFSYDTEGWGITNDGKYLIMSDGTDVLYYLNPDDYSTVKQINVTANGEAVTRLNELEYINGRIYANIWQTDRIAIIQPDGKVIGWIDLGGILPSGDCTTEIDVLNGIAYNAANNRIYVTGKYWCKLFEIEVVP